MEVGKLSSDVAKIFSTLMDLKLIQVDGVVVDVPEQVELSTNLILSLDVYLLQEGIKKKKKKKKKRG